MTHADGGVRRYDCNGRLLEDTEPDMHAFFVHHTDHRDAIAQLEQQVEQLQGERVAAFRTVSGIAAEIRFGSRTDKTYDKVQAIIDQFDEKGWKGIGTMKDLLERAEQAEARVKELELKRGACEVCWTVSWEPIEKREDADGVNTIGPDQLARCGYCWHEQTFRKHLATATDIITKAHRYICEDADGASPSKSSLKVAMHKWLATEPKEQG